MLRLLIAALATFAALFPGGDQFVRKTDRFVSPDGALVAVVIPIGKKPGFEGYESRIELRTKGGTMLCSADYSSEDSDHGYGVAKAAWTPNSQFFVYSLQSSGGHQPWHTPIDFYSRRQRKISSLDSALDDAIADPEFSVSKPDKVTATVYFRERQVTVRLSELLRRNARENASGRCAAIGQMLTSPLTRRHRPGTDYIRERLDNDRTGVA